MYSKERYFLRMLLLTVKGPTSFEDLRTGCRFVRQLTNITVNNHEFATFQEACVELNLAGNDKEYFHCLEEAVRLSKPRQVRATFAMILLEANVQNAKTLFETFAPVSN